MSRHQGLELSAKKALAYISETPQHDDKNEWDSGIATKIRTLSTNQSIRIKYKSHRHSRSYFRTTSTANQSRQKIRAVKTVNVASSNRRTLVPRKVSVENQILTAQSQQKQGIMENKIMAKFFNKSKDGKEKQNSKPFKTLRNYFLPMKKQQAIQKQEQLNINFMQFWVKNRFQQGSVNALVNKLRNNQNTSIRW